MTAGHVCEKCGHATPADELVTMIRRAHALEEENLRLKMKVEYFDDVKAERDQLRALRDKLFDRMMALPEMKSSP